MEPSQDWQILLKSCDFNMAAEEIRDMLKIMEQEAASTGERPYYKQEFLDVLYPFLNYPSLPTAMALLEAAPFLRSYFEQCSPGGSFHEIHEMVRLASVPAWTFVPRDTNYWNPKNRGFNAENARLLCPSCHSTRPFDPTCPDCGSTQLALGTGMGLPGIFCLNCKQGGLFWDCPACRERQKLLDCFQYDAEKIKLEVWRKPFFKSILGR